MHAVIFKIVFQYFIFYQFDILYKHVLKLFFCTKYKTDNQQFITVLLDEERPGAPTDLTYSNMTLLPGGKVFALVSWRPPAADSRFTVDKYKV